MRPGTWLNRIDRIPISTSCNFFSGSSFEKNSKVKRAWPRAILGWVTDREVGTGCARVRTKCAEKTSVGLWGQSRYPIKLPGVTPPGPRSGRGVTSGIRADPCDYTGVCGSVAGHVEHGACGPEWTRHGTCADTGRTDVCQEGTFLACG